MVAAARRWVPRVDPRGSLNALLRANLWKETSVTIAAGKHLFPSRTQQLSPSAPMVLGWQRSGRVGHRRGLFLLPEKRRVSGVLASALGVTPSSERHSGDAYAGSARGDAHGWVRRRQRPDLDR